MAQGAAAPPRQADSASAMGGPPPVRRTSGAAPQAVSNNFPDRSARTSGMEPLGLFGRFDRIGRRRATLFLDRVCRVTTGCRTAAPSSVAFSAI
jgi:hypothetical protein